MTAETASTPSVAPKTEPLRWPSGGVSVLVLADGSTADAVAGLTRLRAVLAELSPNLPGLNGRLLVLDRTESGLPVHSDPALANAEVLRAESTEPYGTLLRRCLSRVPTATEWLVRVPATGLDFAVLGKLLPRTQQGQVVQPDLISGTRPAWRSWSPTAWASWLSESAWSWLFGLVVSDPASPVLLLRCAVLADSTPQAATEFADHELTARANFVGHLLDEYPLRSAWTGSPAGEWSWTQLRRMWADAYRVLSSANFPRRTLPEPGPTAVPGSRVNADTDLGKSRPAAARPTNKDSVRGSRDSGPTTRDRKRKNRRKK